MKAGIIGLGTVGRATALAGMQRGSANEIVFVDRNPELSRAVALDLGYGAAVSPPTIVRAGDYHDLAGAKIVVIAAGENEKAGGATDRNDPAGRLRLLTENVSVMRDIVPPLISAAPDAVILVATDPPDPLADAVRMLAPQAHVLSTGTWLDSLRLRTHLAKVFGVSPKSVQADVLGEHGTSEVLHWSGATIAGIPWRDLAAQHSLDDGELKKRVENEVRFANINIIEGLGASQYGIGIVIARIIEVVLRDEKVAVPIGSYHPQDGVTYSLPAVLGAQGVQRVLQPRLEPDERAALDRSIAKLRSALEQVRSELGGSTVPSEAPAPVLKTIDA
jgi:L-lactate dehydrogenase